MSDRIDPPEGRAPRGPWPEVSDASRVYDHGRRWCINAGAHPDENEGYPDPQRHLPWDECRSVETYVDGAVASPAGDPIGVCAYLAAPFQFGQRRDNAAPLPARIVIESWAIDADHAAQRIGVTPASALHLARILTRLADELSFPSRAA
jgi:hypothetical protein